MAPGMRGALLIVVVAVAIGVLFQSAPAEAAGAARCAGGAGGSIAVVVDFGTASAVPGAPDGVFTACVPLAAASTDGRPPNGLDVLRKAVGGQLVFDSSSKLCAIAGYPAHPDPVNCSKPVDGHVRYWSYYLGSGSGWSYSPVGAAARSAQPGVVEGWRFNDSTSGASPSGASPPRNLPGGRASWDAANICPTAPPQTAAPSTVAPPATAGTAAPGGSDVGSGGSGQPGPSTTSPAKTTGGRPSATTDPGATSTTNRPAAAPSATTTPVTAGDEAPRVLTKSDLVRRQAAGARSNTAFPAVVGVVLVLVLVGVAAYLSSRRRRAP